MIEKFRLLLSIEREIGRLYQGGDGKRYADLSLQAMELRQEIELFLMEHHHHSWRRK
jgi:hypothetical protein